VLGGELVEGEEIVGGVLEQPGDVRRRAFEPVDDLAEALVRLLSAVGLEDLADGGGDHRLRLPVVVPEHVPEEVHRAPLPATAQHPRDRAAQPLVAVRDAQTHSGQPARLQ
jgi:hypothetical protein